MFFSFVTVTYVDLKTCPSVFANLLVLRFVLCFNLNLLNMAMKTRPENQNGRRAVLLFGKVASGAIVYIMKLNSRLC